MADINIEKDKSKFGGDGSKIWLWVIGALILAGIIWWILAANDEPEVEEADVYEQRISQTMETEPMGENVMLVEAFSAA